MHSAVKTSVRWILVLSVFCFALSRCSVYDDGIIQASLVYEFDDYSTETQEGRAILTVEAHKHARGHPLLSLTSVLDISQSMDTAGDTEFGEKTRLEFLKLANRYVVDRLARQPDAHRFGSVVFSTGVEELIPLQTVTEGMATGAKNEIDAVVANGFTNLHGGLIRGIDQQKSTNAEKHLRVVILFTDGMPTIGEYLDAEAIVDQVKLSLKEAEDIILHVVAIGETINYDLLKAIAKVGGGIFYHVVKDEDIPRAFAAVLGSLLTEAALDVNFTIAPIGDTIVIDAQLNGADVEWQGDTAIVHVGNLLLEEKRRVVIIYQFERLEGGSDGLRVNGTYENAVTRKTADVVLEDLYAKRVKAISPRPAVTKVGIWQYRYNVSVSLEQVALHLEEEMVGDAAQELTAIKNRITTSAYKDEGYFKLLVEDLTTYYSYLTRDDLDMGVSEKDRGMLDGLISVVAGGRPSSVDLVFKVIQEGETSLPIAYIEEVDRYARGEDPISTFELDYSDGVNFVPRRKNGLYQVQLTLTPPQINSDVPLSLTVVIDVGGDSDAAKKKRNVIDTLSQMIRDLEKQNHASLGIVLSSGSKTKVLDVTTAAEINSTDWKKTISEFQFEGETALGHGLKIGIDQQIKNRKATGLQSVFVITDGSPTDGDGIVRRVKRQLASAARQIHIHAFGFEGSDAGLLQQLADLTNGVHQPLVYVDDVSPRVGLALWGLLKIGAKDIDVVVRPATKGIAIINSLPKVEKQKGIWKFGFRDISQGQKRSIIMMVTAPKRTTELLTVEVAYRNALKPELTTTETFTVDARNDASESVAGRTLELEIINRLRASIERGLTQSRVRFVMNTVYELIGSIDKNTDAKAEDRSVLHEDLEKIATLLDTAKKGREADIREAEWAMHLFVEILETESYVGSGIRFNIEKRYVVPIVQDKILPYQPIILPDPVASLSYPFKMTYKDIPDEITTERQTMTVVMEIAAEDLREDEFLNASHVFVIEATKTTTAEDVTKTKEGVLSRWRTMQASPLAAMSHIVILVYGNDVSIVLDKKPISEITEEDIVNAISSIKPAGETGFLEAVNEAVDIASEIRKGDALDDVKIVAFVGHSVSEAKDDTKVAAFVQDIGRLDFPATFISVLVKSDADTAALSAYPGWVRKSVMNVHDWIKASSDPYKQPIVKRLVIDPNVAPGIVVTDVPGSLKTDGGFLLPDLFGSETKKISIQLMLSASGFSQILRMPHFKLWDMRIQKWRTVRGEPLSITRTPRDTILKRIHLQTSIKDSVVTIDVSVTDGDWNRALLMTSTAIGSIDASSVVDDMMHTVREKLWTVGSVIYEVIGNGGDGDPAIVKNITADIVDVLIVEDPPIEPVFEEIIDVPYEPMMPDPMYVTGMHQISSFRTKPLFVDPMIYVDLTKKEKPEPPKIVVESGVTVPAGESTIEIDVEIKAPRHKGELIDARAVILVDTSHDADVDSQSLLVLEVLNSLSKRQGKRTVELWGCSDVITELYIQSDFASDHLEDAKHVLDAIVPKGNPDALKVLDHVQSIQVASNVVTVVYWIAASAIPEIEASMLEGRLATLKRHTTKTVMTFKTDKNGEYSKTMRQISDVTGGWAFFIQGGVASEDALLQRILDAARNSVKWIERSYIKNIKIQFSGQGDAQVSKIEVDGIVFPATDDGLTIPSMAFGESLRAKVHVQLDRLLDASPGVRDVMAVATEYVFVRMSSSRQLGDAQMATIEIVAPIIAAKSNALDSVLEIAGSDLFYYLGRNQIEEALVKIREVVMQPEMAGLQRREDVKHRIEIYEAIGEYLKQYLEDRSQYELLHKVVSLIVSSTEKRHYVQASSDLRIRHGPLSLDKNKKTFKPIIAIETPPRRPLALWEMESRERKVMTLAAIFDTADYTTRVDGEMPPLMVQKTALRWMVKKLVKSGTVVELYIVETNAEGAHVLPMKRIDESNLNEVSEVLKTIKSKGTPTSLFSRLKAGLPSIQNVAGSGRTVMLFSHASSVGLVEDEAYQSLLMPYVAYPINPIKVMTYVVGKYRGTGSDAISELTGGVRRNIEHVMHIPRVVRASIKDIQSPTYQSIRLHTAPVKWYKGEMETSVSGTPLRAGIVGDMRPVSKQSIDVSMNVGKWNGDRDIFSYSVSYYDPKSMRWFGTPSKTFRLRRADAKAVKQHISLKKQTTISLNAVVRQLDGGDIPEAVRTVVGALDAVHGFEYQDDSLIGEYATCLKQTYSDLLRAKRTKSATDIVARLVSGGCGLELDVKKQTGVSTGRVYLKKDPPSRTAMSWYGFAV